MSSTIMTRVAKGSGYDEVFHSLLELRLRATLNPPMTAPIRPKSASTPIWPTHRFGSLATRSMEFILLTWPSSQRWAHVEHGQLSADIRDQMHWSCVT